MMKVLCRLVILVSCFLSFACGYSWQSSKNPWSDRGIHRIYIKEVTNNSLLSGAEVPFTSALVKVFSRGNKVKVVDNPREADAILECIIDKVSNNISSRTTAPQISKSEEAKTLSDLLVATEYSTGSTLKVKLIGVRKTAKGTLWTQQFATDKIYPGSNRFGLEGSTSAMINESQQRLALNEVAMNLANDVYDTMLEAF